MSSPNPPSPPHIRSPPPPAAWSTAAWAGCCCRAPSGCRTAIPPGGGGSSGPSCRPRRTKTSRSSTPTARAPSSKSASAASRSAATSPSSPWCTTPFPAGTPSTPVLPHAAPDVHHACVQAARRFRVPGTSPEPHPLTHLPLSSRPWSRENVVARLVSGGTPGTAWLTSRARAPVLGEGAMEGAVPGGEGDHVPAPHVPRGGRRTPRGAHGSGRDHLLPRGLVRPRRTAPL